MLTIEDEQNPQLAEEREKYERGLEPKMRRGCGCSYRILVVLEDEDGNYHCHRYMENPMTGGFDCSPDGKRVGIDTVFEWLTGEPQAI